MIAILNNHSTKMDIPTFSISEEIPDPYTQSSNPRWIEIQRAGGWKYPTLYKTNVNGALMMWWVAYNINTQQLNMAHGQVGGKIQYNFHDVKINQSGRSLHEQAVLEAKSRYNDKYKAEGYRPPGDTPPVLEDPMLANKWEPNKTRLKYPVAVQPKIDGVRCRVVLQGNTLKYYSRGGNEFPHLASQFNDEIYLLLQRIPHNVVLDGEMYVHGIRFNKLISIIKNERRLHDMIGRLVYCIFTFDIKEPFPFEKRHQILADAFNSLARDGIIPKRILLLDTRRCNNAEDIFTMHRFYLNLAFEGTIIYKLAGTNPTVSDLNQSLYKHGRSNNVLKLKDFIEEEADIIGVVSGEGTERGLAVLTIRDIRGNIFNIRPAETFEERAKWFQNPSLIIGKKITIKYFELSEYGIPRFPTGKTIRDYE